MMLNTGCWLAPWLVSLALGSWLGDAGGAPGTILILDLDGDGLYLSDRSYPVSVDLDGDGQEERLSWTAPEREEALLWVDADLDGLPGAGELLRGGLWPESDSALELLARLDDPDHGGDGDGLLTPVDRGWRRLGLWVDRDHDGRPSHRELTGLAESSVAAIGIEPRAEEAMDGNLNLRLASVPVWMRGSAAGKQASLTEVLLRRAGPEPGSRPRPR